MARGGWRIGAAAVVLGTWAALAGAVVAADAPVGIYDFAFGPSEVTIEAGDTVTWSNGDRVIHTATGAGWDTGSLRGGQSATVTFASPGTYDYVCRFHSAMRGTVVVEAAREATPPATDAGAATPAAAEAGAWPIVAGLLVAAGLAGAGAWSRRPARVRGRR